MDIKGKVIIVTGASSGIGKATAKLLAKNGAKLVLTARSENKLEKLKNDIESDGGEAMVVTSDVTKKAEIQRVADKAKEEYGSIDCLVNDAGIMPLSYIKNLHTDEWDQMVDVNLKGVLNGVAAVLPTMIEQNSGCIINLSSSAAYKYFPGGAVYCATKAAVKMFSEGLRQELAPKYGINVTSIEPGAVDTNLFDTITDEEIKKDMKPIMQMTKLEAEDIAKAILYALSQPDRVNVNDVFIVPSEQK